MKLTPAKLTVLHKIATAGFVRGKTAQLRDLRVAGLIVFGAVWPVVAKDNYATLTDAGREALGFPTASCNICGMVGVADCCVFGEA